MALFPLPGGGPSVEHAAAAEPHPAPEPAVRAAGHTTIAGLSQGDLLRLKSQCLGTQAACHPQPVHSKALNPPRARFTKSQFQGL